MNHTRALPLVLLFSSIAFPQTSGKQFSSGVVQANCPVEIKASLNVAGKIVPIENETTTWNEPQLKITLSNPKSDVVAAQITIHGFPVRGQVIPAVLYMPDNPFELTKAVNFDRTVATGQSASIDVSVHDFSSVTSIFLNSVTYSDGSRWHPANRKFCAAVGLPIYAVAKPTPH
jgi:hypothetical protein